MDGEEDVSYYCTNLWETMHKKPPPHEMTRQASGCNSDLGDMCFMMVEYIKDAMKVILNLYCVHNELFVFNYCLYYIRLWI